MLFFFFPDYSKNTQKLPYNFWSLLRTAHKYLTQQEVWPSFSAVRGNWERSWTRWGVFHKTVLQMWRLIIQINHTHLSISFPHTPLIGLLGIAKSFWFLLKLHDVLLTWWFSFEQFFFLNDGRWIIAITSRFALVSVCLADKKDVLVRFMKVWIRVKTIRLISSLMLHCKVYKTKIWSILSVLLLIFFSNLI